MVVIGGLMLADRRSEASCGGYWGLGMVVASVHSQGLKLLLVLFYGQSNGEKLLHMVWRFWVMVLKGVIFVLRLAMRRYFYSWNSVDE
ncbi:hypothetical protein RchiOBHm_Chr5g0032611 [Rosa chinensis]|uniref:Transmembrane protein n=1 Tax=Rosa chinensis TaxID=74649 RepID=A0A2P6QAH5_ROSCH|nr:hypothetical protein RchiOBHm_Chr5g0032611 [Rosa chinensis]